MASVKQLENSKRRRIEYLERSHKIINGVNHKICGKHNVHFPDENPWFPCTDEYFYKDKMNSIDGLNTYCKECTKQEAYIWKGLNREKWLATHIKTNSRPEREKARRDANQKHVESGGYLAWTRANPDKCRAYSEMHRDHEITDKEWKYCLKVFNNSCAYCGLPQEKHIIKKNGEYIIISLHREHADDDGYNDIRNAIPACQSCNSGKHQDDLEEWYRKQKFFDETKLNIIVWWLTEGYKDCIEDKPSYRIVRKKNEGLTTYHHELWSVDKYRNMIECIHIEVKKKDVQKWVDANPIELVETY